MTPKEMIDTALTKLDGYNGLSTQQWHDLLREALQAGLAACIELEEWRTGKRIIRNQGLDEALNSGDGVYRP